MERKYTVEKSGGPRAFRNFSAKLSAQGRIDEPLRGAGEFTTQSDVAKGGKRRWEQPFLPLPVSLN